MPDAPATPIPPAIVSPTIDPELSVDPLRDRFTLGFGANGDPVTHPAFGQARAGLQSLFTKATVLADARTAIAQAGDDPALQRRLRTGAERSLGDAMKTVESTLGAITQHRAKVEDEIAATLQIPEHRSSVVHSQRAADVRASLRALPKDARLDALRHAMNDGDVEAVASVLSASPLASGLSRGDLDGLRFDAERKFAPAAAAMRDNLDRLAQTVAHAGDVTERAFGAMVGRGFDPTARAERALKAVEGAA